MTKPKEPDDLRDKLQDTVDVFVHRTKLLEDFDPEYQKVLIGTYRFYGLRYPSKAKVLAKRIRDTLEAI